MFTCPECGQTFLSKEKFLNHAYIANLDDVRAGLTDSYVIVHGDESELDENGLRPN